MTTLPGLKYQSCQIVILSDDSHELITELETQVRCSYGRSFNPPNPPLRYVTGRSQFSSHSGAPFFKEQHTFTSRRAPFIRSSENGKTSKKKKTTKKANE